VTLPQLRISIIAATLVGVLAALASAPAQARPAGPAFALQALDGGPYYVFDARPGSVEEGRIRVSNTGTRAGSVRLYPVDAATGPTSGAAYLTQPGAGSVTGPWIKPAVGSVRLGPGQSRVVPFTVLVPWGTRAGDHLAGITADPGVRRGRAQRRGKGRFRIDVRALTVIAVQVRVAGARLPWVALDRGEAGGGPAYQQILLRLRNPGNVLVKGRGSLVVSHDGRVLRRSAFALDTFVPGTQIDFPVAVRGRALPEGSYRATVRLSYMGRHLTRSFAFKVDDRALSQVYGSRLPTGDVRSLGSPLVLVAAGLGLLLAGFLVAWVSFRRRVRRLEARRRADDLRRLELWQLQADQLADRVEQADRSG
jgi:hypothetical protein